SLLLALLGGAAGVLLAWLSLGTMLSLRPDSLPRGLDVQLDWAVIAFALVLSIATGLAFGALPALQMVRRAARSMQEGSRSVVGAPGARIRAALVVCQMALAMVLLAGAGLFLR